MNYSLRQLEIFLKVADTGSVTLASEALYLSQPAVSIQLRNLQDQFSIPLTRTIGRKIEVTEFGQEIAAAARNILNQVYEIHYRTLAYQGHLAGQIKIATVSTGKYVMPFFMSGFLKQYTDIKFLMDVTNKQRALESLEKQEVDFALVSVLPENLPIRAIPLMPQKLFLVGSGNMPVIKPVSNNWKNIPLIFREYGSGTRYLMEKFLSDNDISYEAQFELTSNEAVLQAVKAGLGYSIMPLVSMQHELQSGDLVIIPVKGFPIEANWQLICLKSRILMPAAIAFLTYLEGRKEEICNQWFSWLNDFE
jgi:DNA-binding transcriptional LysR family regulator